MCECVCARARACRRFSNQTCLHGLVQYQYTYYPCVLTWPCFACFHDLCPIAFMALSSVLYTLPTQLLPGCEGLCNGPMHGILSVKERVSYMLRAAQMAVPRAARAGVRDATQQPPHGPTHPHPRHSKKRAHNSHPSSSNQPNSPTDEHDGPPEQQHHSTHVPIQDTHTAAHGPQRPTHAWSDYTLTRTERDRLNAILSVFHGTHSFHNFCSREARKVGCVHTQTHTRTHAHARTRVPLLITLTAPP